MQFYVAFAVPIVLLTLWYYTAAVAQSRFPTLRNKRILLLIAHPDDEAMFFAPTLLALTRPELKNYIQILCLSSGDADGLGNVRKREIAASAHLLGVKPDDVHVYEDAAFPDSMTRAWDADAIAALLHARYGAAPKDPGSKKPQALVDAVITFDGAGVSGHPNHVSLYHGARAWLRRLMRGREGWACPVALYALTSTRVGRKYLALLDAPLTLCACVLDAMRASGKRRTRGGKGGAGVAGAPSRLMFVSDVLQWRRAQRAMTTAHRSQMRWFRWGWIVLSRYMVVNDLKRVTI